MFLSWKTFCRPVSFIKVKSINEFEGIIFNCFISLYQILVYIVNDGCLKMREVLKYMEKHCTTAGEWFHISEIFVIKSLRKVFVQLAKQLPFSSCPLYERFCFFVYLHVIAPFNSLIVKLIN